MSATEMLRGDFVVFTPHGCDYQLTGTFRERNACATYIEGWRDGRIYGVASDAVRSETEQEKHRREYYGYTVEETQQ